MRRWTRVAFTLLETVFATLLLCVVFFVLMSLYPTSLFSLRKGHDMIGATNFARRLLEQKRLEPFATLAGGTARETRNGVVYDAVVEVLPAQNSSGSDDPFVRCVRVTVTWSSGRPSDAGVERFSQTLETRLFGFTNP